MAAVEFIIPKHGARSVLGDSTGSTSVCADVLDDLSEHDALYITEEDAYERCQALARGFLQLSASQRSQAIDVLSANLRYICSSAQQLLSDEEEQPSAETLQRHRNGLKMMVHLLHIIAMQAQKDAEAAKGAENAAKPGKATGRGRKAAAEESEWDWQRSRQQVLLAVHDVMRADLRTLFRGLSAAERMVNLCMELALQALEAPTVAKQDGCWPACCDVLIRGAVQHEQLDFVAAALMERARKHEHVPVLAAQAAKVAEDKYNSTQLAVKLLAEFWSCSPEDYDSQYASNSKSVRQAGEVVVLLAELLPKVVSNHIAQLRPYLSCSKAHSIRGALMAATGSVLLQVFPSTALSSSLGAGAAQAHLRSKETLLGLLHTRILDKAAYVRQRVLQTWAKLVEESCVPLNHWNILLQQAIGRLEDESQLVVKAALQLLCKMLHQGIFPPALDAQRYINSLHQVEAELEALLPAGKQHQGSLGEGRSSGAVGEEDEDEDGSEGEADGERQEAGAAWEEGGIKVEDGADAAMEDADQGQGDNTDGEHHAHQAAVSRLRTMIASLKEGAAFCKRLTASLKQVQVLLASTQAGVVHDAIYFLTLCKTYEVTGAAEALRGMWPLVFSKTEGVKDTVLDSWHILHLHNKTPKEQVAELVTQVVPGCNMAELAALEAILAALAQQGNLSVPALVQLLFQDMCHYFMKLQEHDQAARERRRKSRSVAATAPITASAPAAPQQDAPQDQGDGMDVDAPPQQQPAAAAETEAEAAGLARGEIVEGLRHVFVLLSMLAAAQPSAIRAKYVPVLLEVAFSADLADAWIVRHTFITLRHAAPHLVPWHSNSSNSTAGATTAPSSSASDPVSPETHQAMLAAAVRLLVGPPAASMAPNWPSAAEAAVAAVYALSPQPQEVMAAVLEEMFRRCRPGGAAGSSQGPEQPLPGFSAAALSRFFFVLGRTALQHLLCIESLGKSIRQARLTAGRAAAEAADKAREAAAAAAGGAKGGAGKRGGAKAAAAAAAAIAAAQQADDVAGMLGAGAMTADAELDDLVDLIEAQMLAQDQLLGRYGLLLSKMVHLRAFITYPQQLQSCALLALTQLMAVDGAYCSDNVAVLFTLLHKRMVSAPVRVNMVVALADLCHRWPNVLEPWTAYMYEPLADPEPSVKLAALSSLTHLVLGGMVKAKGNVAKVATLLVDDNQELVDRAVLFFESLAASGSGSSRSAGSAAAGASAANPVYNLLPDCLSALLAKDNPPLLEEQMQVIMAQLLAYVKDKQAESLRERLVVRLQLGGPREWRLVAWCIGQLGYSEKGLRRIMELVACYRHTLGEQQVFDVFMTMAKKAGYKASAAAAAAAAAASESAPLPSQGLPGDFKSSVEEWVADLLASREAAIEAAEVEARVAQDQGAASKQQQQPGGAAAGEAGAGDGTPQAGQQQGAANAAADAGAAAPDAGDAAAGAEGADGDGSAAAAEATAGGRGSDAAAADLLQGQQLDLVQSQDITANDDLEPALLEAAAAAVATAGMQRMSLAAGSSSSRAASLAAAAGSSRARRSAATAAAPASRQPRRTAAAVGGKHAAAKGHAKAAGGRSKARPACIDSSGSADDDDSDASSSSGSDGKEDAAGRVAAGRQSSARGSAGAAASGGAGTRSSSRRSTLPAARQVAETADDSSEDDD